MKLLLDVDGHVVVSKLVLLYVEGSSLKLQFYIFEASNIFQTV